MFRFFLIFIMLIPFQFIAQNKKKKNKTPFLTIESALFYNFYQNPLGGVNQTKFFDWRRPIRQIGIQIPSYELFLNPRVKFCKFSYSQILPQRVSFDDTLIMNLTGFNFSMNLITFQLFKKSKIVDLKIGVGFSSGQLRLRSVVFNNKNPFFAPQVSLYNSYAILKRIIVGYGIAYLYDVSNPQWKDPFFQKSKIAKISPFKETCLRCNISIGWKF